ncbi:HAMP domain-containing sensor histidine kinase [Micromonospora sp. WMMD1128]|uniref:sensor histidine kinase n=1 Tax=Micromonospora sp. WMMD1128 TaxID=3015150 RepID=UPI00248C44FF|nr:HAMP domain-containing sensor histidine kinase [Micromonospora sp. WMMD1128]WBB73960.1 HAMP domain-containing sensor histidine kinase [Micromonospora sp. WMMD1128]
MARTPGLSVRGKLTLSYAGFLVLAGVLLLAAVWVFLLRYVPDRAMLIDPGSTDTLTTGVFPVRSNLLRVFAPRAAETLAILLAFGLVGGWILAGRMLAPLTRITDAARTAGTGSLSHRIRMTGRQDEFRELSDAFDTMLDRLESHVAEQRRFAANASHELRTPLAISRTLLEVARADPAGDRDELIDRLRQVNRRAIDLTEALLLLSRGDVTRERVDLSLLAEEAVETLLPVAEERRITLDVTGGPAPATGSAELLARVVTNLVQNAIAHNLPTGVVPTLTEPFQRGTDRARTGDHDGVGLGLAIVHRVVRTHHGTLGLVPRPGGGLSVTVRLPADGRRIPRPGDNPDPRSGVSVT